MLFRGLYSYGKIIKQHDYKISGQLLPPESWKMRCDRKGKGASGVWQPSGSCTGPWGCECSFYNLLS